MSKNDADSLVNVLETAPVVPADVWRMLLTGLDDAGKEHITHLARKVAQSHFGTGVYVRALIEISSYCRNNCYYCGLRCSNRTASRYRLGKDDILESCRVGASLGFNTFVLQGGEDPAQSDEWLAGVVSEIRAEHPDRAITLSVGERGTAAYEAFRRAGADRYLLRHETADSGHYRQLHPPTMDIANRHRCLADLKRLGYQVGSGMMVGSPGQQVTHLVEDLMFLDRLQPQMIGIGPFIPAAGTPFAAEPHGSAGLTLLLISLLRIRFPSALIPATTALATLLPDGTPRGILAGANVVMPNLTPAVYRNKYTIYDNKKSTGSESAEQLTLLSNDLAKIGYRIDFSRGDYKTVEE